MKWIMIQMIMTPSSSSSSSSSCCCCYCCSTSRRLFLLRLLFLRRFSSSSSSSSSSCCHDLPSLLTQQLAHNPPPHHANNNDINNNHPENEVYDSFCSGRFSTHHSFCEDRSRTHSYCHLVRFQQRRRRILVNVMMMMMIMSLMGPDNNFLVVSASSVLSGNNNYNNINDTVPIITQREQVVGVDKVVNDTITAITKNRTIASNATSSTNDMTTKILESNKDRYNDTTSTTTALLYGRTLSTPKPVYMKCGFTSDVRYETWFGTLFTDSPVLYPNNDTQLIHMVKTASAKNWCWT
jgi:hypothetical protein